MTVAQLKRQADRLIQYMGDKHRLRMKRASALEAIAYLRGVANWNTLAAQAGDGPTSPGNTPARYTLTWQHGVPQMAVSSREWRRHTLAIGSDTHLHTWLMEQLEAGLRRKDQGVFFFHSDDPLPENVLTKAHASLLTLVDYRQNTCTIDLADGLSPAAMETLVGLSRPQALPASPSAVELIHAGRTLLVVLPKTAEGGRLTSLYAVWGIVLRDILANRCHAGDASRRPTLLLGLSNLEHAALPVFIPVIEQARAFNTVLLMGTNSRDTLAHAQVGDAIVANAWTQLYLGGLDEQMLTSMLVELRQAQQVAVSPHTVTFARTQ